MLTTNRLNGSLQKTQTHHNTNIEWTQHKALFLFSYFFWTFCKTIFIVWELNDGNSSFPSCAWHFHITKIMLSNVNDFNKKKKKNCYYYCCTYDKIQRNHHTIFSLLCACCIQKKTDFCWRERNWRILVVWKMQKKTTNEMYIHNANELKWDKQLEQSIF